MSHLGSGDSIAHVLMMKGKDHLLLTQVNPLGPRPCTWCMDETMSRHELDPYSRESSLNVLQEQKNGKELFT